MPGAAGQTWSAGTHILRVRPAAALAAEMAAWAAAAAVIATPEVIDLAEFTTMSAALLRRLPGVPAGHLENLTPDRARKRGLRCGELHALLGTVPAPAAVVPAARFRTGAGTSSAPAGDRLLHLDLHPFNVLVDENDTITGVIDWANTGAGHPNLDRARSGSILTLDPSAVARETDPRWAALAGGWIESGQLRDVPPCASAWACRFMLQDLGSRYSPGQLARVHAALGDAEARRRGHPGDHRTERR